MSDWLTRFDEVLITYGEALALPHRVRAAWACSQFEAVVSGFSHHLFDRYPVEESIRIAKTFALRGEYDLGRIARLLHREMSGPAEVLQEEGYPLSIFQAIDSLLCCIASPYAIGAEARLDAEIAAEVEQFLLSIGTTAEYRHSMEEDTAAQIERLVACLGMAFAAVQCWRQGVVTHDEPVEGDYNDALQGPFYRFSCAGYAIAGQTKEADLTEQTFSSLKLDWTIERPLPEEIRQRCQLRPPPHEWPAR